MAAGTEACAIALATIEAVEEELAPEEILAPTAAAADADEADAAAADGFLDCMSALSAAEAADERASETGAGVGCC